MNFSMNTRSSPNEAFALGGFEAFAHVPLRPGEPHPLAAAASRGLHHHRIADLARNPHRIVGSRDVAEEAGNDIDARRLGELLRLDLVAHRRNRARRRADEGDPILLQHPREALPLGKEAVARMHCLGARLLAGEQYEVRAKIAFARRRRPEAHRLVGHPHMRRPRVGIRINGHGFDAHLLGRADHAAGNLAAIGDEDFLEHLFAHIRNSRGNRLTRAINSLSEGLSCRIELHCETFNSTKVS
jgi:hypothetical protein